MGKIVAMLSFFTSLGCIAAGLAAGDGPFVALAISAAAGWLTVTYVL